jgi:hypothetical protein
MRKMQPVGKKQAAFFCLYFLGFATKNCRKKQIKSRKETSNKTTGFPLPAFAGTSFAGMTKAG